MQKFFCFIDDCEDYFSHMNKRIKSFYFVSVILFIIVFFSTFGIAFLGLSGVIAGEMTIKDLGLLGIDGILRPIIYVAVNLYLIRKRRINYKSLIILYLLILTYVPLLWMLLSIFASSLYWL